HVGQALDRLDLDDLVTEAAIRLDETAPLLDGELGVDRHRWIHPRVDRVLHREVPRLAHQVAAARRYPLMHSDQGLRRGSFGWVADSCGHGLTMGASRLSNKPVLLRLGGRFRRENAPKWRFIAYRQNESAGVRRRLTAEQPRE